MQQLRKFEGEYAFNNEKEPYIYAPGKGRVTLVARTAIKELLNIAFLLVFVNQKSHTNTGKTCCSKE